MIDSTPIKVFVSYSWTNPDHEQWVIDLATQLRESGVDAILDKWDLKEGHDATAFMEQMVTNPEISKVLIVCDKHYADKADRRHGGVGTETQIISSEVYSKQDQEKFVVAVTEKNDNGKAILPTYYKSRKYIDFTDQDKHSESFEMLLRWIYDKPLHVKPPLGDKPVFLDETDAVSLETSFLAKRAITGYKESRPYAEGALDEYLKLLSSNFEKLRITRQRDIQFDDQLIESIDNFLPYLGEFAQVCTTVFQYGLTNNALNIYHRFFESVIPYMDRMSDTGSGYDSDFDNYKFINNELFLYFIAISLKYEKFKEANSFLQREYYTKNVRGSNDSMSDYTVFHNYLESLKYRNDRLHLRLLSYHGTLLFERAGKINFEFRYIMQADFVLYMRYEIIDGLRNSWWPNSLVYSERWGAFEIFARSKSKEYFDSVKRLININNKDDLGVIISEFNTNKRCAPHWQYNYVGPGRLIGFENIATIP